MVATDKEVAEAIIESAKRLDEAANTLRCYAKRIETTGSRHPAFESVETILNLSNTSQLKTIITRLAEDRDG